MKAGSHPSSGRPRGSWLGPAVLLLLGTAALSCGKDLGIASVRWPCNGDGDCAHGFVCLQGTCRDPATPLPDPGTEPVSPEAEDIPLPDRIEPPPDLPEPAPDIPDPGKDDPGVEPGADVPDRVELVEVVEPGDVPMDPFEPKDEGPVFPDEPEATDLPAEEICQPDCDQRNCGPDGCGGTCGPACEKGQTCVLGVCTCLPDCAGQDCGGDDGCGGSCGVCTDPFSCLGAACVEYIVNADNTVTDVPWKLVWGPEILANKGYEDAVAACVAPWRVPTIDELRTLVLGCPQTRFGGACKVADSCGEACSLQGCVPCGIGSGPVNGCYVDTNSFSSAMCGILWSSTTAWTTPPKKYVLNFQTGELSPRIWASSVSIRCVKDAP